MTHEANEECSDNPSSDTATSSPAKLAVHLAFVTVLLFVISLKYYLYFASPITGHGLTPGRLGATLSHLLILAFAYVMCLGSPRKLRMGLIAAPTLFFGVLTLPILGWLGLVVMVIVYRLERRKKTAEGNAEAA
ncbi:hypothetical protein ACFL59_06430 [Planctomycetota bacterium]